MEKEKFTADYVEFVFQDQYLGRNDMWRLGRDQVGQCLYVDQQVSFIGVIAAKVHDVYVGGMKVSVCHGACACMLIVSRYLPRTFLRLPEWSIGPFLRR